MKFCIDTANLAQIKEAAALGILENICDLVDGDISAEVSSTDVEGIIKEGQALASIHANIVVKVPMIKDGNHAKEAGIPIHS